MSLKQKVVSGFIWALLERFSVQGVSFVVSMVLARLLTPSDYGTVALLTIFIALSGVLVDSGFGNALVQKKEATEEDFNSVFYLSLMLSGVLYGILFFAAPWVADFYKTPALVGLLRLLALTLIFNAINGVQNAELSRKMLFHLSFRISLIGSFVTAVVGIALAFRGYGPWALAWSSISGGFVGVLTRWYFIAWRPRLMFSWRALKGLFCFGWKLTISALLDVGYGNLYGLIIGRFYSRADLAFVNKGRAVPQLAMDAINGTLGRVAFPALAQVQDKRDVVRETMRRMIATSTFFVFPLMTGCAVCAEDIVYLLFGTQWGMAVPYVHIACFTFALWPFHTINLQAINALGRSDLFLMLEIIKKGLGLTLLIFSIPYGVWWMMALGAFVTGPLSVIINAWPNRKLLNYTIGMQLRDIFPSAFLCVLMACVIYPLNWLPLPTWGILILQILLGMVTYFFCAWLFKVTPLRYMMQMVTPMFFDHVPMTFKSLISKLFMRLK